MRVAVALAVTLAFACTDPLCGCSPEMSGVVFKGVLRESTGDPRPGMLVRGELAPGSCGEYISTPGGAISAPDGGVRLLIYAIPVDSFCVRFSAQDTMPGSAVIALPGVVRALGSYFPFDTVGVDFVLPP